MLLPMEELWMSLSEVGTRNQQMLPPLNCTALAHARQSSAAMTCEQPRWTTGPKGQEKAS